MEVTNVEDEYTVQLTGEIDVYTVPKLKELLLSLTEKKQAKITVDLLHTSYIDSTGLGVFISAYKTTEKSNNELTIINVHEHVFRLFQVTGLDRIMNVHVIDSEQEE